MYSVWALPFSLATTKGMHQCKTLALFSFPPGTEMFHFPGFATHLFDESIAFYAIGFPHSEISGSKVAKHLPEAYRSHATSFIASHSQGIHHLPLKLFLDNSFG